mgnify:CR=1 FL=1|tara:strand:+ start:499 stop:1182 length:684 start_codon:yes stop_codon:yes gene_type:complete
MEKITDKKIWLAVDERIDRVVEQLEEKINAMAKANMSQALECRIGEVEDKFEACCQCIDKNNKKISLLNDLGKLESSKLKDLIVYHEKSDTLLINMIDVLEEKINKCFNKFDKIDDRLDDLEDKVSNHFKYFDKLERLTHDSWFADNQKIEDLEHKIQLVEREIPDINQDTDITDRLNVKYDDLEAKNYQLKSEIDELKKYGLDNVDVAVIINRLERLEENNKKGDK